MNTMLVASCDLSVCAETMDHSTGTEGLTDISDTISAFASNEMLYLICYLTGFRKYTLGDRSYHPFASTDLASVVNILGFVRFFT